MIALKNRVDLQLSFYIHYFLLGFTLFTNKKNLFQATFTLKAINDRYV